ncbi:DNA replication/repair protein RecF [Acidiferrimicrobium sp. IK]|uniref:DNA replication/repair protein RecF n=1 Tax=Acidiferrimicrobium sp. IK TaxID=2871700 RepID=UPI0021CB08E7|nr:DNA replication/repair protein RecF [Acidiferrimicrobium sp. IK]MCU4187100.1 DNA replication/repair protein RecF [Acidiferrimicrobium sp. IK]
MHLDRLWLSDFRSYEAAELVPAPEGLTVVSGANGEGKTNLLEAVAYLASLRSFRGAPGEALIRVGAPHAVVRAEVDRAGRRLLIEAELRPSGRDRVQVNRQALRRTRDLLGSLQVTVFAPDDLTLVKGGPSARRQYLDDLLVALHPRHDATQSEVERVLRQRNALLKQAGGRATPDVVATLDVWDAKLASAGETLVAARAGLTAALSPVAAATYEQVAVSAPKARGAVRLAYQPSWDGPLLEALAAARTDDLRRGVTTVGPHRDELAAWIGELPARTHASQGEQRSLALALRLAGHSVVTGRLETPPVLLLDDVFSELDPDRSAALLAALPAGQALLTTAGGLPPGARPAVTVRVEGGKLLD